MEAPAAHSRHFKAAGSGSSPGAFSAELILTMNQARPVMRNGNGWKTRLSLDAQRSKVKTAAASFEGTGMTAATTIGPYRILDPLGRGGMGVVYRAQRADAPQTVALKTVKVTSPRGLDAIRREIEALTQIRHPGIVTIVDHGVHEGRPWYAMDLLEGESLRHFGQRVWSTFRVTTPPPAPTEGISRTEDLADLTEPPSAPGAAPALPAVSGPYPAAGGELAAVLGIVRRVCETLAYIHGEGLVNRDLKPENILLDAQYPILIDFGLVAHHPGRSGREAIEAQHGMSGTLPYMSPEQIRGEFVDARADLYSIGCLLYELVTGRPPFTGSPQEVVSQHLSAAPLPPSKIVTGVPPSLENLILRLLEKKLPERVGFADEAAAWLASLTDDAEPKKGLPRPRPYLYRPGFFGRESLISELTTLRDRAALGGGAFVLLGGESGVGKTRVAMEMTRFAPSWHMQLIVGESSPMSFAGSRSAGGAPLHALRPLLQAISDRCHEGGGEVTERLLGQARPILASYEPSFAELPDSRPETPVISLSGDTSRQRLFRYLAEALAALAAERPVLWILDDLAWADELSLAFLSSLSSEYLESTPVFILGTYRSEDPTDSIASLLLQPHIRKHLLPRLGPSAVSSMIADMLALREPWDSFAEFVAQRAEGNPFFVVEYVRAAVAEGLLHRGEDRAWQWRRRDEGDPLSEAVVQLPKSVRALIAGRLRRLSADAQLVSIVTAVIGREAETEIIRELACLSDAAFYAATTELLQRQVLQPVPPDRLRFDHDRLRELAYEQPTGEQLWKLHAHAGDLMERRSQGVIGAERAWATIGRHLSLGRSYERAADYLRRAADHAKATHGNADALQLYREAIAQVCQPSFQASQDSRNATLADLYESLGEVCTLTGQHEEAGRAYLSATELTSPSSKVARARLYRKMGKTLEVRHQHEDALLCYARCKQELERDPDNNSPGWRTENIQVHIEELWVCYWLNRVEEMAAIVASLGPLIARDASPSQRNQFFQTQMLLNFRRSRYVVTEQALGFARAAVESCQAGVTPAELYAARMVLGLALLFNKAFSAADRELQAVTAVAERAGDIPTLARSLTYLALAARMRARVDDTRHYSDKSAKMANLCGAVEYAGAALANHAWLSLRAADPVTARQLALRALDLWTNMKAKFPFHWMALVPLLEAELIQGDLGAAVGRAEALLSPTQQFLPGAASDALGDAIQTFKQGNLDATRAGLERALRNLDAHGYH
jgi:eukaryotic-like serine/threonine-protein kinase